VARRRTSFYLYVSQSTCPSPQQLLLDARALRGVLRLPLRIWLLAVACGSGRCRCSRWVWAKKTKFSTCSPDPDTHMQGHQYMWDGCSGLRTTKIAQQNIFVEHNASAGRSGCVTGPGRGTGAAARRGHDDVRCGHHQLHLGGAAAHLATAAHPATPTSVCSCLVDAHSEGGTEAR
jgi:hypothetical protein